MDGAVSESASGSAGECVGVSASGSAGMRAGLRAGIGILDGRVPIRRRYLGQAQGLASVGRGDHRPAQPKCEHEAWPARGKCGREADAADQLYAGAGPPSMLVGVG